MNGQLFLLNEAELPIREDVVEFAAGYDRSLYTGKILGKDEEFCLAVCELVLLGVSERAIARRMRIARQSVRAVVAVMERRGKIKPLKERLSAKMSDIIELGLDALLEKLQKDEVPANILPIVIGVLCEKKAMIDGDPTGRIEIDVSHHNIAPAAAVEYIDRLRQARRIIDVEQTADEQSKGLPAIIEQNPQQDMQDMPQDIIAPHGVPGVASDPGRSGADGAGGGL